MRGPRSTKGIKSTDRHRARYDGQKGSYIKGDSCQKPLEDLETEGKGKLKLLKKE